MRSAVLCSLFLGFVLSSAWAGEILIKGSDTLLNLVQQLAEAYMKENPDAEISIVGGGSGVGIAALIDGNVDIANASRKIKPKELRKARKNGVEPVEFVIAIDALAIIVNPRNPVDKLTIEQLGAIYRGEIGNWKEVGGPDMRITLYGRQPVSGTFVFFRERVLKGDYSSRMRQMAGNAQIIEAVKRDKSGIGYVGLGYVKKTKGVKVISVGERRKDKPLRYISPLVFLTPHKPGEKRPDIKEYPLARPLFQYTNGRPTGAVRDFIQFELSDKGQRIVERVGFIRVPERYMRKNMEILKDGDDRRTGVR